MPIYLPKKIIPVVTTPGTPLFFLAGPIRGGGDWQHPMALELLVQNPDVQIACPSRWTSEHPLHEHFVQPFSQAENRQLVWERFYMEAAALGFEQKPYVSGCLIFWLGLESQEFPHPGPEPYAMDTRREVGKYTAFLQTHGARIVVGGSRDFFGLDVILDELSDALGQPFPFYTSMAGLAKAAFAESI